MAYTTLIDTDALKGMLNNSECVIVDCRFSLNDPDAGYQAFCQSHIPGAVYANLDHDLSSPIIPGQTGRHPMPTPEIFAARLGTWGIDKDVQVVVYDDVGGAIASRLWWMLKWLGHENAAVLNGGWTAWKAADLPVSNEPYICAARIFEMNLQTHLLVDADMVESIRLDSDYCLIDSRSRERYLGENETIDTIGGHIPGAVNIPFAGNIDESGFFISGEQILQRFESAIGQRSPRHIVLYCGSGVTACHNILALIHAGLDMPRLYVGSWSGWIAAGNRSMAQR
ncbi:sulfurtransferase [bacterium]|nr:sulfurtransferase [bacterium]